nr:MAG TPA: hypothetical protein [Microviridae sp.]
MRVALRDRGQYQEPRGRPPDSKLRPQHLVYRLSIYAIFSTHSKDKNRIQLNKKKVADYSKKQLDRL